MRRRHQWRTALWNPAQKRANRITWNERNLIISAYPAFAYHNCDTTVHFPNEFVALLHNVLSDQYPPKFLPLLGIAKLSFWSVGQKSVLLLSTVPQFVRTLIYITVKQVFPVIPEPEIALVLFRRQFLQIIVETWKEKGKESELKIFSFLCIVSRVSSWPSRVDVEKILLGSFQTNRSDDKRPSVASNLKGKKASLLI